MTDRLESVRMLILAVLEPTWRLWEQAEDRRVAMHRLKNPDRRITLGELEREMEGD